MVRALLALVLAGWFVTGSARASAGEADRGIAESRAAEAAVWGMPAVNYDLMLQEMLTKTRGKVNELIYWGRPLDWHNQTLTPNPDTLYFMTFLNTRDVGPIVIDIPPASSEGSLNANIVNVWQQPLEDAGLLGVDKGGGLRLLMLPPGYAGDIPAGYVPLRPNTWGSYALIRSNLDSHEPAAVARSTAYAKRVSVYPLSKAANPPPTVFTDVQDVLFDSTIRYDTSYYEGLNRIVQDEPWLERDRVMIDQLRSLGIEKGKPFAPTGETRAVLEAGIRRAHEFLAATYDKGLPPFFEGTHWSFPAPPELIEAASAGFDEPDRYPVDARGLAYHYAYIGIKRLGQGQFYLIDIKDGDGQNLDGGASYRLRVPPDVPVEQYWSLTAYDRETHALIKGVDRASRASNSAEVRKNADGSVDLYLGPKAPEGMEANWIPTDPARGFEVMFRLYGPTKALFDKAWTLPDIERVSEAAPGAPGTSNEGPSGSSATEATRAARALEPAHADLPRSAGVPAQLANEDYVRALARVVYYWGYPAVDGFGRTSMWQVMKDGPGTMLGLLPGAPVNTSGCLADYMSPSQRWVVTPNNDTIYGAGFADLGREPAVIQTPMDVPAGHYWTIQVVDIFTNVVHQLGSASATPGGKFLLVGPDWSGEKLEGFVDVLRMPTNTAGVFPRSFAARTPDAKARAVAVLDQIGMYPLGENRPGPLKRDCRAAARNAVFPPGVTAAAITADPDASRPQWVDPKTFWDDLARMLDANPKVGPDDAAMADQARTLIALRASNPRYRDLLDRVALEADAALHASSTYTQVGVDAGNGWQRQEGAGLWGTDWFSRAQATVVYIYVNDYREATYFIRGTDAGGTPLHGRHGYTVTFPKGGLPPMDRTRGGFWSLTMYDKDYFMLPDPPNGRTNIGTVNLDADELKFADDGSLTLTLSHEEPTDPTAKANWLPAPDGQFALIVRAYVPTDRVLRAEYRLPDVQKGK